MALQIDREKLHEFADVCQRIADDLNAGRYPLMSDYAGTTGSYTPVKWRAGIKVTLGTVDADHAGRRAGEAMADRIGEAGYAMVSAEEGFRAKALIARRAAEEFNDGDTISADQIRSLAAEYLNGPQLLNLEHP